jgi:hypothetical protein
MNDTKNDVNDTKNDVNSTKHNPGWSVKNITYSPVKEIRKIKNVVVGSRFGHTMCPISEKINKIIFEKNEKNVKNTNVKIDGDFYRGFVVFGGVNEERDYDDVCLISR